MPGIYLAAIVFSAVGIVLLDARFKLAAFARPVSTLVTVVIGVAFFVAWDLAGIATGTFRQGESSFYLGFSVAPHLPIEEIAFLTFLVYLSIVVFAAANRWLVARAASRAPEGGDPT